VNPDQIRALQKRLGLTDGALADLCGVNIRSVRYWKQVNGTEPGSAAKAILAMLENGTHPHVARTAAKVKK
jgi:DNA-binding transcriptional regulator YiaG